MKMQTTQYRSEAASKTAVSLQLLAVAAMQYYNALTDRDGLDGVPWQNYRHQLIGAAIIFAQCSAEEMRSITATTVPMHVTRTGDKAKH